ncbi:hypothetical protein [Novosphingobium lindaniclasticum]|uniref:hypothetical protein n=1 Tax=Novosphingobium lindaniclasticum TaxID=1329895 RepID=UPI002409DCB7|nr:hypothetical protein [Novosphingobium lindaniclasticum]
MMTGIDRTGTAGRHHLLLLGLTGSLALAGCSAEKKPDASASDAVQTDPALTGPLGDRIVVDPEKVQDRASPAGDAPMALSAADRSAEAVAAAKKAAADAVGGKLLPAPVAGKGIASALAQSAATAAQISESTRAAKTDCSAKVQYSKAWAAKLPTAIPLYPRGTVQEAAGTDDGGCSLRVVNFGTAVSPEDVVRFYHSSAQLGGYTADYRIDGGDHVIGGRKGGQAYVVYARKLGNGVTEVDLVTSGK